MEVYLLKTVQKIGLEGEIIKVGDGFARNFLIPKGLAVEITPLNKHQYESKIRKVENRKSIIATEMLILADKIGQLSLTIKRRMHDNGQLYGSVKELEIVELLSTKGIDVAKNNVEMPQAIKNKGSFKVIIKLSPQVKTSFTLNVVAE
jgi:large subunit ribosomal protein L9